VLVEKATVLWQRPGPGENLAGGTRKVGADRPEEQWLPEDLIEIPDDMLRRCGGRPSPRYEPLRRSVIAHST